MSLYGCFASLIVCFVSFMVIVYLCVVILVLIVGFESLCICFWFFTVVYGNLIDFPTRHIDTVLARVPVSTSVLL